MHKDVKTVTTTEETLQTSVESMRAAFRKLPDPRSTVNRKHSLDEIMVISVCAVLAGADGPESIACWAKAPEVRQWLSQRLDLAHGIPSRDTFRRVLQRVRPDAFQVCFTTWLRTLAGPDDVSHLAVDGKCVRRSHDAGHDLGPLHLVSVWATEQNLTLAQVATDVKSNEITAIPQVLELVDVKGATITIDAMGCQKAIAKQIVDSGGDYILAVKGNQPTLEQDIESSFHEQLENDFSDVRFRHTKTRDKGHGRVETREYYQAEVPEWFSKTRDWRGLKTLVMVIRTVVKNGQETGEVQYYISSCDLDIAHVAHGIRRHWSIENSCHWILDMTFREDESRIRDRHVGENVAWLKRFALSLLKQAPGKTSVAMKRRKAAWSVNYLSQLLATINT